VPDRHGRRLTSTKLGNVTPGRTGRGMSD
jgi:hypothetical protein